MPSVREKRVYVAQADTVEAYVAADLGVAVARVSGDTVGEFSLVERCTGRDVAATAHGVAAATDEDVLVGDADGFEGTGFGPAVAVTNLDGDVLAAGEDGHVARYDGDWTTVGTVDAEVRALDADLVAAADGVHRLTDDGFAPAGLDDAQDVAAAGVPHAATPDGLFYLGNGWMDALEGAFSVVAGDPATASAGDLGRAHAATADDLYAHDGGDWQRVDLPVEESVADVAYAADAHVILTEPGTLAVDAGEGVRHRSLGLRGARALAVAAEGNA